VTTFNTDLDMIQEGPATRKRRRRDRGNREGSPARFQRYHLFFYLLLGAFAFSSISAFAWVFNVSLKTNREFVNTGPWTMAESFQWENYVNAWSNANVGTFFWNSVLVSTTATVLGVAVSAFAAYPLARIRFRYSGSVLAFFLLGLMVPWMVTFIPLYFTLEFLGLLNTRTGLILVYAAYNIPFNLFVLTGFMRTLPEQLEEAATLDGAGAFSTFVRIILPLSGPGLASVTIISFLNNWNEFFYALVFVSSESKMTLPLGLFRLGQAADYGSNWVTLFAGMMITIVPVLMVFALLQRQVTRGLTAGALKG
jgi:ABC-type glycerol-3-phosphate transport system permease component